MSITSEDNKTIINPQELMNHFNSQGKTLDVSVLVIEDSVAQSKAICQSLRKSQLDAYPVYSAGEALKFLESNKASILLVDYELPDMSGIELIDELKNRNINIPFVITTARGNEAIAVELMKRGALDYQVKDQRLLLQLPDLLHKHLQKIEADQMMQEAEEAVRNAEQRTARIIESSPEAFVCFNDDGEIIDWNSAAERDFGWNKSAIIGSDICKTIIPEKFQEKFMALWSQLKTGQTSNKLGERFEFTMNNRDSKQFPVEVSLSRIEFDGRNTFQAFIHDISKRKEIESQLYQSEKMASIGQLAAGVAHEINNPIGFVKSNLSTLTDYVSAFRNIIKSYDTCLDNLKQGLTPAQLKSLEPVAAAKDEFDLDYILQDVDELLHESADGLTRVKEIVANLKSFARVDEASVKEADINEGLDATLKVVWNELKYKCTIHKDYGELPLLRCYASQLNQVFMNLLVNAAQAIKERGDIYISTRVVDGLISIKIRDTGCGIKESDVSRLFTPFYTTKPVGSGTGLGLSISYGIVKKHQGEIRVESTVGQGTTFEILLPVKGVEQ